MLFLNVVYDDGREELVELSADTVLCALATRLGAKEVQILAHNVDAYKIGGLSYEDRNQEARRA